MMRIESISDKPDRSGQFRVRLSDGSCLRLYRQTVEEFALFSGMELDLKSINELRESANQMSAKMRAVRIVSATNISANSLERRLVQKGETPEQAKLAVQWMQNFELVNDKETAALIVERCIAKGYGKTKARQVLYEKMIPRELWEEALCDYPDQTDKIFDFLKARLKTISDQREVKRVTDALLRKGHSYSAIKKAMAMLDISLEDTQEDFEWQI